MKIFGLVIMSLLFVSLPITQQPEARDVPAYDRNEVTITPAETPESPPATPKTP
ncbi:Ivanolysin, partial [Listeria seeligeri]|nr:Ivanolysin [Listeria seeligeri]